MSPCYCPTGAASTIPEMPRLQPLIVLCLFPLLITACTEGKPPESQDWSNATGTEAYERLWWKAIQEKDFKTAYWRLGSIYTLTTSAGIRDREQAEQYFKNLDLTSISLGELEVKPHGVDMVVSYVATVQSKSSPTPQRFYMMTVWQEAKKGWMAIAHSEVPAS